MFWSVIDINMPKLTLLSLLICFSFLYIKFETCSVSNLIPIWPQSSGPILGHELSFTEFYIFFQKKKLLKKLMPQLGLFPNALTWLKLTYIDIDAYKSLVFWSDFFFKFSRRLFLSVVLDCRIFLNLTSLA